MLVSSGPEICRRHSSRRAAWPAALLGLLIASHRSPAHADQPTGGTLTVRFFAAGHGDSALLRTDRGHTLLLDAGTGRRRLGDHTLRRRILPYFKRAGIRRLNAFIISHPHNDHFGDPVLLRRRIVFPWIMTNADGAYYLERLQPALAKAAGRAVPVITLRKGYRVRYGRLLLEVLHPPGGGLTPQEVMNSSSNSKVNNRSLVIRARYGRVRFLFTGDLSKKGERRMLAAGANVRADVLKLGHHGQGSTSKAWLRAVLPRYAVFSCCDRPWYTRMSLTLRRMLRRHRVKLFRTDKHRDIHFVTDGRRLRVRVIEDLSGLNRGHRSWVYKDRIARKRRARKLRLRATREQRVENRRKRLARLRALKRQTRMRGRVRACRRCPPG